MAKDGDRVLNSEIGMGNEKREAGKLGGWEAQKLKAESREQKASEGGTGNAEMKRNRQRV